MSSTHNSQPSTTAHTVLFDGVCNFCAWSVNFIIQRDPSALFRFASLQSDIGRALMAKHGLDPDAMDSFVLVEGDQAYTQSTAALRVAHRLTWPWSWCYGLILLPQALRDAGYRFIARNRYRWFGKAETCLVPTPEIRARFL